MHTEFTQPATLNEMLSAFFVSGMYLNEPERDIKLVSIDNDIEVVSDLCTYATPLANMMTAAVLAVGKAEGVFVYEVAEPFGNWFAALYLQSFHLPPRHVALAKLRELVMNFYSQAEDCDVARLAAAIGCAHGLVVVH
ncbi:hypothetical protein [Massilia sp.]|uniref:hypothetical protein n=1 Tax=Massilia sp. TaxID=1882437 RepID=UPI00352C5FDA